MYSPLIARLNFKVKVNYRMISILTWMCQLRAAIKWSRSMKDASKKQENMLFRSRATDFRERTTINVHVRPPTVACVALSNVARADSLLPYFSPKSPRIEQAPIAHVRSARDQSSRHIAHGFFSYGRSTRLSRGDCN